MEQGKIAFTAVYLKANSGYRTVSIFPQLKADHPVADVTLVRGKAFKTVTERLD